MFFSPLRVQDRLFSHIHVVGSPEFECGHRRENNQHFLMESPLFINERMTLQVELLELGFEWKFQNLLFGNKQYTTELNCGAFECIQKFIQATGIFSQ